MIAIYEEERYIVKVQAIVNGQVAVQCLEKPFGIKEPQELEQDDRCFYKTVYHTELLPELKLVGRSWKWVY